MGPVVKSAFLCGIIISCLALTVLPSADAEERVDFFDREGRRTGYAIVDTTTGRVDFYDVSSRRTGWGQLERSGRVERFVTYKVSDKRIRRFQPQHLPLRKRASLTSTSRGLTR